MMDELDTGCTLAPMAPLLSAKDVARRLAVSSREAYRLMRHHMRHVLVGASGRLIRVSEEALAQYLRSREVVPPAVASALRPRALGSRRKAPADSVPEASSDKTGRPRLRMTFPRTRPR
jgi:hypothetical protein